MQILKAFNFSIYVSRAFRIRWIPRGSFHVSKYTWDFWINWFGIILEVSWSRS
jgi:hypothetical protein